MTKIESKKNIFASALQYNTGLLPIQSTPWPSVSDFNQTLTFFVIRAKQKPPLPMERGGFACAKSCSIPHWASFCSAAATSAQLYSAAGARQTGSTQNNGLWLGAVRPMPAWMYTPGTFS